LTDLDNPRPKRKVLSLKLEPQEANQQPQFVERGEAFYMVWRVGGDTPKRIYTAKEQQIAISHAKKLCDETGMQFHVMRSYRAFMKDAPA